MYGWRWDYFYLDFGTSTSALPMCSCAAPSQHEGRCFLPPACLQAGLAFFSSLQRPPQWPVTASPHAIALTLLEESFLGMFLNTQGQAMTYKGRLASGTQLLSLSCLWHVLEGCTSAFLGCVRWRAACQAKDFGCWHHEEKEEYCNGKATMNCFECTAALRKAHRSQNVFQILWIKTSS